MRRGHERPDGLAQIARRLLRVLMLAAPVLSDELDQPAPIARGQSARRFVRARRMLATDRPCRIQSVILVLAASASSDSVSSAYRA